MLERLVAWGVRNAFGFVFKTLLEELAQVNLEKYTQNFFSALWQNFPAGVGIRQQEQLEIVFGQALKEFLLQVQQQLEDADVSEAELQQYVNPLQQFIGQEVAQVELGKPFLLNAVPNADVLAAIWRELELPPLPADFNWQLLTRRYTKKVKVLLRESDELNSIFDLQNLAAIQRNAQEFAGIVPDFDLMRYRTEIQKAYGHLRLDSFDTSGYSYSLKLWNMFIAQNVREVNEALPQIYELPKEDLERLKKSGELEDDDIEPEILEQYKRAYIQQTSRSVLEVINDKQTYKYIVILGDPGSGKSSLLQYLTQQWAETPIQHLSSLSIPLLIELRTYMRSRDNQECQNFLEFFQQGSGFICPLNQHQLDTLLKTGKAYVMFDGLDEVFEPRKREQAITDIINFTQNYPLVRVLVTSRVIGYKPQRLRDANFRHFMLQDLELEQIQEFINRWHNLAFSDPLDKQRKKERLERAIQDFLAIRQLASNPLLLTMMAILNRNQELPRDRAELYNQASRVLLQQWDLEKLLIRVESASIDYKDKQAMLRQVAYSMQTSKKGLSGNLINKDNLESILIDYLQDIGIHQEQRIAQLIIEQLRERNFILCFLGADYYAFVHRTFLEYFCAWEYVWQFEKERSITIDDLTNNVFGNHWQDETWHEVLRLIAGMIDAKFVGEIIEYLMNQDGEAEKYINLFLAAKCFSEVRNPLVITSTADRLFKQIKDLIKYDLPYYYDSSEETNLVKEINKQAIATVAAIWKDHPETKTILQGCVTADEDWNVRGAAIQAFASNFSQEPDTKTILKDCAIADEDWNVRLAAIQALASNFSQDPDTKTFLQDCATADDYGNVRLAAIQALVSNFSQDPDTKTFLQDRTTADDYGNVRLEAIQALASDFLQDPDTKTFLQDRTTADDDWNVRLAGIEALASNFPHDPDIKTFLKNRATTDKDEDVRLTAIQALASNFSQDPDTQTFLQNCATSDDSGNVRLAAIQALASNFPQDPYTETFLQDRATADYSEHVRRATIEVLTISFPETKTTILKERAIADYDWNARCAAIQALASNFIDDPDTKTFLKERAIADYDWNARRAAIEVLASNFIDDPDTKAFLKHRATADNSGNLRLVAIEALANNFIDNPDIKTIIKERAIADYDWNVRLAVIQRLTKNFSQDPDIKIILKDRAITDYNWEVRRAAIQALADNFPQDSDTKTILKNRANADYDGDIRLAAIQGLAEHFSQDQDIKIILKDRAITDYDGNVRFAAMEALASNFPQEPDTKTILKDHATADKNGDVRFAAMEALASNFPQDADIKTFLKERATTDDWNMRRAAIQILAKHFKYQAELFDIYYNCAVNDPLKSAGRRQINPRRVALEIIIKQYPQHPQTLPLLRDKAENDPDKQVREFAQKKLKQWEG